MVVDRETQKFIDLYVPKGSKIYHPPATEDVEGNIATARHLQGVAADEQGLLAELIDVRFE